MSSGPNRCTRGARRWESREVGIFRSFSRRRPVVGRRLLRRLKSAFSGAARRASAFADANGISRSAQANRGPKAVAPIEIGLPRRLRAGRRPSPTQETPSRSAQAGRRPEAFAPIEIGLPRRLRAGRRPLPTQMGSPGRRRPVVGRRPLEVEFIRRIGPTAGWGPSRRLKSAFQGACAPGVGLCRRKWDLPVGAGRPWAGGPLRSNSFDASGRPLAGGLPAD
jgi:hypothetical protein